MRQPVLAEMELGQRVSWLIRLRWIASSTIIYGTLIATSLLGLKLDPLPLYLIGVAMAAYNSLYIIAMKWSEAGFARRHSRNVRLLANGQIATDLLCLTLLIHFTGGVENPVAFYLIFHVIIASILLSRLEAFLHATLAGTLYGSLLLAEFLRLIPHVRFLGPSGSDPSSDAQLVMVSIGMFISTLYVGAYLATSIMTHLRRRDAEISRLSSELERKARELEGTCGNLKELEQVKSGQLQTVSHAMKPSLLAIQGWLRSLLDGLFGEVPERQRELIRRAEIRTQELVATVSDLLVLSRVRETRLLSGRRPVDLARIAERVAAGAAEKARDRDICLSTHFSSGDSTVLGDASALEQLLTHLVSNAVNYTLNGGKVDISIDSPADVVRVQVADTGIGIPAADLPRIFNEFFRSENARRYSEEGTGLGLSIARTIAESHGGEIEVESHVGVGTTVTLILPAGREQGSETGKPTVT